MRLCLKFVLPLPKKKTIYSIRGSIEMTGPYMLNMELKPLFQITTIGKLPNCVVTPASSPIHIKQLDLKNRRL